MSLPVLRKVIVSALLILSGVGVAYATPMTWTDTYDPRDFKMTANSTYTYTQDIRDGLYGFRPGVDSITNALLTIYLYDDNDSSYEYARFSLDGGSYSPAQEVDGISWWPDSFDFSVASLLSDGLLNIKVKATQGDFYFAKSTLVATGDRRGWVDDHRHVNVPEPNAIALFGVGLLGMYLSSARRRRREVAIF